MSENIGFIGLGNMGQGMSRNLLNAGFPLTVWNRTAAKAQPLADQGARVAASPAEVAGHSDIVVTCVSDTPDVEAVLFGPAGVVAGARPGSLVIDCSTISPAVTRDLAARLAAAGIGMLDAPVSGGVEGAAKGALSIMVGGYESDVARAMPVLQAMGKQITHVGEHGAGQTTKLMNQILVVVTGLAVSEALLFGQGSGVNLSKALEAVKAGAGGSWMLSSRGPHMLQRDWSPFFTIDLQQKDLRLVLDAADAVGVPIPATSLVFQLYRSLQARGCGGEGNQALIKALENLAGLEVSA